MKRFAIGDIHNRSSALEQCLERSGFDKENDVLISLGDIVDGPDLDLYKVMEELRTIKNLIICIGNHDLWFKNWVETGMELPIHIHQGGEQSLAAYDYNRKNVPESHINLLNCATSFYIDGNANLFVHGGFDERHSIQQQDLEFITWDRDLVYKYGRGYAKHPVKGYKRVFLGHTSTQAIKHSWDATEPIITDNVIALDTGGGWNGKLTIMDVDTLEYWQSDLQTPS
ncbi:MAG: metallophosphoesterase [Dehalococcoidales bacterium]|jgi:serine/threonine protein phosphatase 1